MTHQRALWRLVSAGFLSFLVVPPQPALPRAAGEQHRIAIEDARVIVGDGQVLEGVDLLVTDGIIEAVGPDLLLPPDAEHIDAAGLTVHAGWIDAFNTSLFVAPEPAPEPVPGNAGEEPDFSQEALAGTREANRSGIAPERRAREFLRLSDPEIAPWRQAGFTEVLVAPPDGLLRGGGCLVDLSSRRPRTATVAEPDVLFAHLRERLDGGYPGTLMGNLAHVRQTFLDAVQLRDWREYFEQQPRGTPRPPSDTSLEALLPVLDRSARVAFVADSELDIRRALRLAEEFELRPVLVGAAEGHRVAGLLAEHGVPVIARMAFGDEPEREGLKKKSGEEREEGTPGRRRRRPEDALTAGAPAEEEGTAPEKEGTGPEGEAPDPVNLEPEKLFEQRKARWREQVANVRTLLDAGVSVALTTDGCKDQQEFLKNLRKAVELGLDQDAALRALTVAPAEILGVAQFLGRVEPGMLGSLTLVKGDPLGKDRAVRWTVVGGRRFEGPKEEEKKDAEGKGAEALAGTWLLQGENQGAETFHATLVLRLEEGEWSGTVKHPLGEFPVTRCALEGNEFEAALQVKFEREAVEFVLRGTVGEKGLTGTMETPFGTQSFTGARALDPKETMR